MRMAKLKKLAAELYVLPDQIDAARAAANKAEQRMLNVHKELLAEIGNRAEYEEFLDLLREQGLLGADWMRQHLCTNYVGLGLGRGMDDPSQTLESRFGAADRFWREEKEKERGG
jgi:hypothetical protein